MRLKYISKIVGCIALSLGVSSCQDFLEQTNPNTLTTGIFWEDLDDCDSGLTAVYNMFKNESLLQYRNGLVLSDLAWPNGVSYNAWPKVNDAFHLRTYDNSNAYITNQWTYLYMGIFRANQVLEGLDGIEDSISSEDDKLRFDQIKGQAIFFRALFHFYAYSIFNEGKVPLVTSVPVESEDFYVPCRTRSVLESFVRSQMEMAEELLPKKGSSDDWADAGRPRSETASAIIGLTYLHENDPAYEDTSRKPNYAEAARYFKKVIDNSNYSLAGIADNMTELNENNNESLLEIQYTLDYNSAYDSSSMSNLSSSLGQYVCAPSLGHSGGQRAIPAYWLFRTFGVEPVDKKVADNKIYLKTDYHNDIYYFNNDDEYVVSGEDEDGLYVEYYVVKKYTADLVGKIRNVSSSGTGAFAGTMEYGKYYVLYKKLYVKDVSSREPVDEYQDYNDFLSGTYPYAMYQTISSNYMSPRPYNFLCNGTWNVYNEGSVSDPVYYRYRTHSLRASYTCVLPTDEDMSYYGEPRMLDNATMTQANGWFRKYSNWDTRTNENDVTDARSAINLRVMRLASVYLWYAEALLEGGETGSQDNVNEAMLYINRLRKRAGTVLIGSPSNDVYGEFSGLSFQSEGDPDPDYDQEANSGETASSFDYADLYWSGDSEIIDTAEEVMNHIKYYESPLEISTDGFFQRFIDLRRWNIFKERLTEIGNQKIYEAALVYNSILTESLTTRPSSASSYIIDFDTTVPCMATEVYDTQFELAAQAYSDYYAYFQIPYDEILSNPNITKVVGDDE